MSEDRTKGLAAVGSFAIGVNYWASHAGTGMWSDWRPEVVREDLRQLAEEGLTTLRVFPLWPDFQPLETRYGGGGEPVETVGLAGDRPDGLNPEMLERFRSFAHWADQQGIRLIVGLITGWMSGRLFMPAALAGKNPIIDPECLRWQIRFVRGFVAELKDCAAIAAWDFGNECNVMGPATRDQAYLWASALGDAIRAVDLGRPIVSGMHSLEPDETAPWRIQDQGELTDILTTHPYPLWTRHTDQDAVPSVRTVLHSSIESLFYQDVGGKPCLVEEMGNMGPDICDDQAQADFYHAGLFGAWAAGLPGVLWWCAWDQGHLTAAPYDWVPVERHLGVHRPDRSPRPMVAHAAEFGLWAAAMPTGERECDACVVLTHGQDAWGVALNTAALMGPNGVTFDFRYHDQKLPRRDLYVLPGVRGVRFMSRRRWSELLARVEAGSHLLLSLDGGLVGGLDDFASTRIRSRSRTDGPVAIGGFGYRVGTRLALEPIESVPILHDDEGEVVAVRHRLGAGTVTVMTVSLESALLGVPNAFDQGEDHAELFGRLLPALSEVPRAVGLGLLSHRFRTPRGREIRVLNAGPLAVSPEGELGAPIATYGMAPSGFVPPYGGAVYRIGS